MSKHHEQGPGESFRDRERRRASRRHEALKKKRLPFQPDLHSLERRMMPTVFTVTSVADDGGSGTLRWAIEQANSAGSSSTIDFDIGTPGSEQAIALGSALPNITEPVFIDGWTQEGSPYSGTPLIVVDGSSAGAGVNGLTLGAGSDGSMVRGLVVTDFSAAGIEIDSNNSLVIGSYLGVDAAGNHAAANAYGVLIAAGVTGNTIGGTAAGAGNVISGNTSDGVNITGSGTGDNVVAGNLIGTNAAGTAAIANAIGVEVQGAATGNTIGGVAATPGTGAGNVISGNSGQGVYITGSGSNANVVSGNVVGLNAAGEAAVPNEDVGIWVESADNTIGGTVAGAGNLVAGNLAHGIYLNTSGATGNLVAGDVVGLDETGAFAIGNTLDGIADEGNSSDNTIGGTTAAARNVVSGNDRWGISFVVWNGGPGQDDLVQGNDIGTNPAGTAAIGNGQGGMEIQGFGITIGGTTAAARNIISGNGGNYGVDIDGSQADDDLVEGDYIGTDVTGAVALGNYYGVNIEFGASDNTIGGLTAVPGTGAGDVISGNNGHGLQIYGGAADNLVAGDIIGLNAAGTAPLHNAYQGIELFSAGEGNTIGGTSAGSGDVIAGNWGGGIELAGTAGALVAGDVIGTNLAGASGLGNGWFGLRLIGSSQDTIGGTGAAAGDVIAGNAWTGFVVVDAENYYGVTGPSDQDVIEGNDIGVAPGGVSALANNADGLDIDGIATQNTIGGTAAGAGNVISANAGAGISLDDSGAELIQGNLIGTNAAGTAALRNAGDGIDVSSDGNTIGGTTAGSGNVVSGNAFTGIEVYDATGTLIAGNRIGTNSAGTAEIPNAGDGVALVGSSDNTIGGSSGAGADVISGNILNGIHLYDDSNQNLILGNFVGTNAAGTAALGNGQEGIAVDSGSDNTIGGTAAGAGNVVSGNGGEGVSLGGSGSGSGLGSSMFVSFLGDTNPGRFTPGLGSVNSDTQFSYEMFTGYTSTDLYVSLRVSDNIIVANPASSPIWNDEMELFVGGNPNDPNFSPSDRSGDNGAFQLVSDILGDTAATGVSTSSWSVETALISGGYAMEFTIPLSLINTSGTGYTAAGPGSLLKFNVGTTDNDYWTGNSQQRYGELWRNNSDYSPYLTGESAWDADLYLDDGQPSGSTAPLLVDARLPGQGPAVQRPAERRRRHDGQRPPGEPHRHERRRDRRAGECERRRDHQQRLGQHHRRHGGRRG